MHRYRYPYGDVRTDKINSLSLERIEFKDTHDVTVNSILLKAKAEELPQEKTTQKFNNWLKMGLFRVMRAFTDEIEIERTRLVHILFNALEGDVEFIFNNNIKALSETKDAMEATFNDG